MPITSS